MFKNCLPKKKMACENDTFFQLEKKINKMACELQLV